MTWIERQDELVKMGFVVRDCELGGEDCVLIYPSKKATFDIKWTEELMQFRSSIWTKNYGIPVSLSFKKFFNWGEREDLCAPPESLHGAVAVEKVDGSTLIVSKFNGELIVRTRGTVDARDLDNGSEIDELIKEYPVAFDNELINRETHTLLFEWTTPTNRIVLDYGDAPQLHLIGVVQHNNYKYMQQDKLDAVAVFMGVERPVTHPFDCVERMMETVKAFKDQEGICLYFGKEVQDILKVKGTDYLAKHAFKSHCTINSVIDMFIERGRPLHNEFLHQLEEEFDYECVQMAVGYVSDVCDAYRHVQKMIAHMEEFVAPLRNVERKEAAIAIMQAYGKTNRSGYAFNILDGKSLDDAAIRKLLHQRCKYE